MNEPSVHHQALPEGTRLQEFELRGFLGAGGFGIAYLGWNTELQIPVAIKEYLPSDCAVRERSLSVVAKSRDDAAVYEWGLESFLEEARMLARFKHPNIVQIYGFFRAHGTGYIVMEYVEGQTLSERLKEHGVVSEGQLRQILLPLLEGLEEVHRSGLTHRDIKPGNIIMRASDDSPVLLDFGAARQTVMARSRSMTAVLTPGYAPLEQYSEKGRQGPWTDVYALGALCCRAMTGKAPEESSDRILEDTLEPLEESCRGQGSPEFLRALDWALRVRPEDRPQSLSQWRAALVGVREPGQRQEPRESKPVPSPAFEPKRRWVGKLAAGLLSALVVAGGGYFGWQELGEKWQEEAAELEEQVKQLLEGASADLSARRLTRPARNNAWEKYQAVLHLSPGNAQAEAGMRRVLDEHMKLFREALSQGDFERAGGYLTQIGTLQPDSRLLEEGERRLTKAKARVEAEAQREAAELEAQRKTAALEEQVKQLLEGASADLSARRLTRPAGNNAWEKYQTVLSLSPGNVQAAAGMGRVLEEYMKLFGEALSQGDFERARGYLTQIGTLQPDSRLLEEGERRLAEAKLMEAVHEGNTEVVQLLIDAGANVNARDNVGNTVLMEAVDVAVRPRWRRCYGERPRLCSY